MADLRGRVWDQANRRKVRVETRDEELARLIREQATDDAGNHSYWPGSGRHQQAASLEELEATTDADAWDDPTFDEVLACND